VGEYVHYPVGMVESVRLEGESFCYLMTRGRVTGEQHTIEIWFAMRAGTVYMLSGGRERSDWVKNLLADSQVKIRIGDQDFGGSARLVDDPEEDAWARQALVEKYQKSYAGDLTNWRRHSLLVAVDFEADPSSG
jgi:deazaflavin-dependent oxidoreductase (nitroreductase family)